MTFDFHREVSRVWSELHGLDHRGLNISYAGRALHGEGHDEAAVRLAARREHSAPIIAALKPSLEPQLSRILQQSELAEDIRYTLELWPGLICFLDDGTLELDTNPVENEIRPIALKRKSALLAGNETVPRTGRCSPRWSPPARCPT
jgi:hypothetical protein